MNVYKIVLEDEEDQYVQYIKPHNPDLIYTQEELLRLIVMPALILTRGDKGHMDFAYFNELLYNNFGFEEVDIPEVSVNLCEIRRR